MNAPQLRSGFTSRTLLMADASAVVSLIAAQEAYDTGRVSIDEADIVADWQRPSYDLSTNTIGVFHGDQLVAYAEVLGDDRGNAAVHPDFRGRGLGSALADWMQATARAQGAVAIGMSVPQGSAADRLLEALGYHVRWESWALELPDGTAVPERPLPEGYTIRSATPDDYEACWTVVEDAFLEWSLRARQSLADWLAQVVQRPGFEPWQLRLVADPAGEVVAVTSIVLAGHDCWIDKIATRRDQRGRGIAQAMLADAFATATAHGASRFALSTDSRTGARGLYEKVGMHVVSGWVNRAIAL